MNFKCPFCNHHTTITGPNSFSHWQKIEMNDSETGKVGFNFLAITCPNTDCNKLWLRASLYEAVHYHADIWKQGDLKQSWQLLPESESQVLPDYIPEAIKEDYYESCRIRDLSPKASATLSRRCLQGMIRDFYGIKKGRLKDEIDALEEIIDPLVWQAIDAVRKVGNIGAHMEKDINLIIDVEPGEAQLLINLIEQLINDWYVARKNKQDNLDKLTALADRKDEEKKEGQ